MLNKFLKILLALVLMAAIILIAVSLLHKQKGVSVTHQRPIPRTNNITPVPLESGNKIQGESDAYFNQQASLFLKKYPWYENIPESSNYFIGFDAENNLFFIDLYPDSSLPTPINTQVENLKKEIAISLQKIGVNTSIYTFNWRVFPK